MLAQAETLIWNELKKIVIFHSWRDYQPHWPVTSLSWEQHEETFQTFKNTEADNKETPCTLLLVDCTLSHGLKTMTSVWTMIQMLSISGHVSQKFSTFATSLLILSRFDFIHTDIIFMILKLMKWWKHSLFWRQIYEDNPLLLTVHSLFMFRM